MLKWFKRCECKYQREEVVPSDDASVPLSSPARALERSLMDPETRGEWERSYKAIGSHYTRFYTNSARAITITDSSGIGYRSLITPFTLSKAEEKIVCKALEAFDEHHRSSKELEVLGRLVAKPCAPEESA